jgi:general secretion pathway protein G
MSKTRSGFTIVELLVVIVVIAILAAITVVAYNGIQDRAEASKTASAIQAYKKALTLYKIDNGSYPVTGAMCLGDQYTAFTGQSTPACRYSTSTISAASNAASRDLLKPYLGGSLPMPSTQFLHSGASTEYVGGHFYGSTYAYDLDGKPVVTIEYYTKADTCPVGPVYSATPPHFASPSVSRSQALADGSRCFLLLPND